MSTKIGELLIDMGANVARLQKDMGMARREVSSAMKDVRGAVDAAKSSLATLGFAVGGGGLAMFIKSSIDATDNLGDLSKRLQMSARDLVGYQLAAEQNGMTTEGLATAVKKLSVYMTEHGSELKKAGITATDAHGALLQLSDLFKDMPEGPEKVALAIKTMGKSGADAIPLLNGGSEALAEMIARGQELNKTTEEMIISADHFNDKIAELNVSTRNFGAIVGDELLVVLNPLVDTMTETTEEGDSMARMFGSVLAESLRAVVVLGGNVGFVFNGIGREIGGIAAQMAALATGDFKGFSAIGEAMREDAEKARADFDAWEARMMGADKPAPVARPVESESERLARLERERAAKARAAGLLGGAKKEADAKFTNSAADILGVLDANVFAEMQSAQKELQKQMQEAHGTGWGDAQFLKLRADEDKARDDLQALADAQQFAADQYVMLMEYNADWRNGVREGFNEYELYASNAANHGQQVFETATRGMENAMVDFVLTGRLSFRSFTQSILADLARIATQKAIAGIGRSILSSFGGGGAGSLSGNGSVQGNADYVYDLHSGGIAGSGEGSGRHRRDPALFIGAPKYHGGGLAGDEMPAVLKRGEGVFTEGQMKKLAPVGQGGNTYQVSVTVDATGGKVQGDPGAASDLGRKLEGAVRGVLMAEMRPGGLLAGA